MTTVDASTRGRRNRAKGASAEREVARWLRPWFADARRAVVNGWTAGDRTMVDPLDIDGLGPGLCISVKDTQREYIASWMAELEQKRDGRLGLLVTRRKGKASPGDWWCWLPLNDLLELCSSLPPGLESNASPVRMVLADVMDLLVAANYAPSPRKAA